LRSLFPAPALDGFRTGSTVLSDSSKNFDFVFPFAFFFVLVIGILATQYFYKTPHAWKWERFLIAEFLISLPALLPIIHGDQVRLGDNISGSWLPVLLSQISLLLLIAPILINPHWSKGSSSFTNLLLLGSLVPFASLGVSLFIKFILFKSQLSELPLPALFLPIGVALIVFIFGYTRSESDLDSHKFPWLFSLLSIVSLPILLPSVVRIDAQETYMSGVQVERWLLFLALIAGLIVTETVLRSKRNRPNSISKFSSVAISLFIVVLRWQNVLPTLPTDDFHFGEFFTPFELWKRFGQLPYRDILPVHGVILNYIPGMWNHLLNDGSAMNFDYARSAGLFVIVALAHLLIRPVLGVVTTSIALCCLASVNFRNEGDLLALALMIIAFFVIRKNHSPEFIGLISVGGSALCLFMYPLMGTVMILIVFFVILFGTLITIISRDKSEIVFSLRLLVTSSLLIVFFVAGPAGVYLRSAISYVVVNGGANSDAHGISLDAILNYSYVLGVPMSFMFVLGFFFSLYACWQMRRHLFQFGWENGIQFAFLMVPGVFVFLLLGRFLGRVDNVPWSLRPTIGSLAVLGFVIPASIALVDSKKWLSIKKVSLGFALITSMFLFPIGNGGLFRDPTPSDQPSGTTQLAKSLPSIGVGTSDTNYLNSLNDILAVTSGLKNYETVSNFSNRVALTGIFGWKSPTKILAPYVLASTADERMFLSQLQKSPPDYVFLSPGVWHDGVSLSLRNPFLFRWVLDRYSPFQCGFGIWATKKTASNTIDYGNLSCPLESYSQQVADVQLWSHSIGSPTDLSKIPIAWGRRSGSLMDESLFALQQTSTIELTDVSRFEFSLLSDDSIFDRLDLLIINSKCQIQKKNSENPYALITWGGSDFDRASFEWAEGTLILPLDTYPSWVMNQASNSRISLEIPNSACNGPIDIQVSGLRRPNN
jgi:hypothetical protein